MNVCRASRRRFATLSLSLGVMLLTIVLGGWLALRWVEQRLIPNVSENLANALALGCLALILITSLAWTARSLLRDWELTRDREEWLATTLRSIGDAIISTDAVGRITLMNGVAHELTGWTEQEAKGKPLDEVFLRAGRERHESLESPFTQIKRLDSVVQFVGATLLLRRDGTERMIAENGAPIRGADGAFRGVVMVFRDVTERELGESALRASQQMFRLITEHVSDMIAVLDLQGRRLYNSNSYERLLGSPNQLYLTDSFLEIHPEDRQGIKDVFAETIRTGVGQRAEYRMVAKDGGIVHIESLGSVVRDYRGEVDKVLVVSRDVSERKASEVRLRQECGFTDTLINSMPGIFYLYDSRRVVLRWNKNFETVTGYSAEEIPRLDPFIFFKEEDQARVHQRMVKCLAEGKADIEVVIRHKSGRLTPYYVTGVRIDIQGNPCMLGMGIDITARNAAEAEVSATLGRLRQQNATLSELAHHPALLGNDLEGAFGILTQAAARALQVRRASIWFYNADRTAMHCARLFIEGAEQPCDKPELRAADYPNYFRALAEGRTIPAHYARNDPRTSEFTAHYLVPLGIRSMLDAPIRTGGELVGVLCNEHISAPREWTLDEQNFAGSIADLVALCMEVWQRREAEARLRDARDNLEIKVTERTRALELANERLKDLDRLKSQFLATMSHELRTPLNSIIGFTGILRQGLAGPINPEQEKQLGMVHFSAKHLLGLINDLLDLSRIESGKMEVVPDTFLLRAVVEEVVQCLQPIATQKKLTFDIRFDEPRLELHTDRKKCFQILLNLVSNAVKFTERGAITIELHTTSAEAKISVSDTGIGIKPESMEMLFEAFRQVDGSARRTYEGTGLGLYLSKQLATLLGGRILAESEFGCGSRFTFAIPRTAEPAATS